MEKDDANASTIYYLYCPGFHREMLVANSGGNGHAAGLTIDEINDAYINGLNVEVNGTAFKLNREGSDYDLLNVTSIRVIDRFKAPLVVYNSVNSTGTYSSGIAGLGRVSLPQSVVVERTQFVNGAWKMGQQIFSILLHEGDAMTFEFGAQQPIHFRILAPGNQSSPSTPHIFDDEANITSRDGAFIATRSGEYLFVFDLDHASRTNVTFNANRLSWDPSQLLFIESEFSDGPFGGIARGGFYYSLQPTRLFTVGRTWYGSFWTDRSWSFKSDLKAGDVLSFAFNSTEPITFQLLRGEEIVLQTTDRFSLKQSYTTPSSGGYVFKFEANKPDTSLVSFSCRHSPVLPQTDEPVMWVDPKQPQYGATTFFPPSISSPSSITGRLGDAYISDIGRVMTLTDAKTSTAYVLHVGEDTLLPAPTGGFTMLGNLTLTDLNEAYLRGITAQLKGVPFDLNLGNSTVRCFHVNNVMVEEREKIPLMAIETLEIVSGFQSWIWGDRNTTSFPTEFNLGFDYFDYFGETIYANPERFFYIKLQKGQTIRITINATSPITLGIYNDGDSPSVLSFGNASPSSYTFYNEGAKTLDFTYTANHSGYTTIAMRAYHGEKAQVRLDVGWG
jgi:hypothetical protein